MPEPIERIVIVESDSDHSPNRRNFVEAGFKVSCVGGAAGALALVREAPVLVLVDGALCRTAEGKSLVQALLARRLAVAPLVRGADGAGWDDVEALTPYGLVDASLPPQDLAAAVRSVARLHAAVRRSDELCGAAFLDGVFENSPYPTWIADAHGTMLRTNKAFRESFRVDDDEVVGSYNILSDAQLEQKGLLPQLRAVFEEGRAAHFSTEYDTSLGKEPKPRRTVKIVVDVAIQPLFDAEGRVASAVVQHVDVGARDALERRLTAEEAQLQAILDNSHDAIGVHIDGTWEVANPAAVRLFGAASAAELIGTPIRDVIAPGEREKIRDYVRARIAGVEAPQLYITRGLRKDGREFEMEVALSTFELEGRRRVLVLLRDISQRLRAEKQLREAEELYRKLVETIPDGLILHRDGDIVFANTAANQLFGAGEHGLEGTKVIDRVNPDFRQRVTDRVAKSISKREPMPMAIETLVRFDGTPFPAEVSGNFVSIGGFDVIQVIFRDVTQQVRAAEQQQTLLLRYQMLLQTAQDGIHILDRSGNLVEANPVFCKMLGYSADEMMKLNVADWDDSWTRDEHLAGIARFMETGGTLETRHRRKDGSHIDVEISVGGITLDGGQYLYAASRDISDRKKAQKREKLAARYARNLLESSLDPLVTINADGKITDVNAATERITGIDRQALVGTDFAEYFTEPALARQGYETAFHEGKIVDYPLAIRHRNGEVFDVLYNAAVFRDDEGDIQGVFAAARDVTAIRRIEEEKTELQSRFAQSQKMESLGVLASGLAHEMNNVLSTILTLASAKQLTLPQDDPSFRAFQTIAKAAERGGKTVQNLLGFSRKTAAVVTELNLNELVVEYADLLGQSLPSRLHLHLEVDPALRLVKGDPSALTQVLANLCSNAVDAMPETGVLTIRTRDSVGFAIVEVEDTGTGMTPEVQLRAADPFFTTKPHGRGTGLGLSLAYRTLQAHGAQLKIESSEGHGTTIRIHFPCFGAPVTTRADSPAPTAENLVEVLVVDDDALIRESLAELLETLGHKVTTASGGREALAKLQAGLAPGAVILDLNMPDWSGADTLGHLRPLYPFLPVLLSTGRTDQVALDLVEAYPRVSLLAKPFTVEELRRELADAGRAESTRPSI